MSSTTLPADDSFSSGEKINRKRLAERNRWIVWVGTIAVLLGSGVLWRKVLQDRFVVKNWGVIEEGQIYRSGQISKWLIAPQLQKTNIDVIIDLSVRESGHEFQEAEIAAAEKLGVILRRFPLGGDGTGDIESYAGAIQYLVECQKNRKVVLLHCQAGADRTGGVTYCFRTLVQGHSPETALDEMLSYGWKPGPHQPLIPYLDENIPVLAQMLADRGVIAKVPSPLPLLPLER